MPMYFETKYHLYKAFELLLFDAVTAAIIIVSLITGQLYPPKIYLLFFFFRDLRSILQQL